MLTPVFFQRLVPVIGVRNSFPERCKGKVNLSLEGPVGRSDELSYFGRAI